ncbi:radical S-adenosyl methionine domain-containing protein 1 [Mortierella alpina]|nr:radical S-adenosyl methionine domain-containing protein 1 [Mortierella alpina]
MERSLVAELEAELVHWGLDNSRLPVRSIYFGETEISMEGNPSSTASLDVLKNLHSIGINRYSLGIQSFQARILEELGRDHTPSTALRSLLDARSVWPGRVSMDLIMGHSGQTLQDWVKELRFTMDVVDNHLSLYHLTVERGTELHRDVTRGNMALPDAELAADMYETMIQVRSRNQIVCAMDVSTGVGDKGLVHMAV